MKDSSIKNRAKSLIKSEMQTVGNLVEYINDDFVSVVKLILQSRGRVVLTGIGKSANIAAKIVATMNSTGTPAVFMHAADAIHGDLGIVQPDDIIICISNSGNTPEIKVLAPLIKSRGNILIALVGNTESALAKQADYILRVTVEREACPLGLAPTNSTTAQLVMGDALAICLLEGRGFTSKDFAKYHPGGALGKKLYTKVGGLMLDDDPPCVLENQHLKEIIIEMSHKRMGAVAVVDDNNILKGMITDGDLRRMLEKSLDVEKITATQIMTPSPITTHIDQLAIEAYHLMENRNITQLIVVDNNNHYVGMIHLHDILKEGVV
ncbi:arabinose-5-phosphate isomerase [Balneicella halophila]|uniref:Arabinose-5-phosphate isomerase n=1 Tax=Balneicella halophila TaxID=1537566 RepID=A0A7L4UQU7_BALHA|nr:KpsF/GutQ family sugar-phosphate isomerase [Balneicella halophila]PVX50972.1 arabinose-5-phosphate isomerase [Balneicella halophila]